LVSDQAGFPKGHSLTIDLIIPNTPQLAAQLEQPIPADPAYGILESDPLIIRYMKFHAAEWLVT
jgi:hypothetical protein